MSYFKTTKPEALAAWEYMDKAKARLCEESDKFAAEFNAKKLCSSSTDQIRFYGVKLNDYHSRPDNILWTSPDRSSGVSRPRSSLKKRPEWTKEQFNEYKSQLEELKRRYQSMAEPAPVDKEPFWNALGTSWSSLCFSAITVFKHGDALFIKTDLKLDGCTEILGSEYDTAYSAIQTARKEAA